MKQTIGLVVAVLAAESTIPLLLKAFPVIPPICLLAFVRAADIAILLRGGAWSYTGTDKFRDIKQSLSIAFFLVFAGLLLLIIWESVFGAPLLKIPAIPTGQKRYQAFIFYTVTCFLSPVAEELFFRGILYRKCREKWNMAWSTALISLLFAVTHLAFSGQILIPFAGGIIFCLGYEKSKFILTPILLHIGGNTLIYMSPFLGVV